MHDMRNEYVLAGYLERKRLLRRFMQRWERSIKMDLRETGLEDADWIHLDQDTYHW
jgi:hypothetical protein